MLSKEKDIAETLTEITEGLSQSLQSAITKTLNQHLDFFLSRILQETEFYKKVTTDMRTGLKKIYDFAHVDDTNANSTEARLFAESTNQLNQVIKDTEEATVAIMEIVEKTMAEQTEAAKTLAGGNLSDDQLKNLAEKNKTLGDDLSKVLTLLSFQDLTGQRIKLATNALREIESTLLELYISSGLLIKAYSNTPEANIEKLEEETKSNVDKITQQIIGSKLKGPTKDTNQADIDALLAQFDL